MSIAMMTDGLMDVTEECSTFLMEEIEIEMEEELAATVTTSPSPSSSAPDHSQEEVVCLDDTPCSDSLSGDKDLDEDSPTSIVCKWTNCDWPGSYDDLVDHIREIHVELQPYHNLPMPKKGNQASSTRWASCSSSSASTSSDDNPASVPSTFSEDTRSPPAPSTFRKQTFNTTQIDMQEKYYVCLWEGCKVYGIRSQKRSWLDRHVLQHSGDKPFKCIVEKCGQRFKTQSALERHVNAHFNVSKESTTCLNSDGCSEHGSDDLNRRTTMMRAKTCPTNGGSQSGTPSKMLKKKKGPRHRRFMVRNCCEDFFDTSIMDQIQFRLFQFNQAAGHIMGSPSHFTLHSKVMAKRKVDGSSETQVLLRWHPENIRPDEWIPESSLEKKRQVQVPLNKLPSHYSMPHLLGSSRQDGEKKERKNRRK